jgi:hypothetical protein
MHLPTFWCDGKSPFCIVEFEGEFWNLNTAIVEFERKNLGSKQDHSLKSCHARINLHQWCTEATRSSVSTLHKDGHAQIHQSWLHKQKGFYNSVAGCGYLATIALTLTNFAIFCQKINFFKVCLFIIASGPHGARDVSKIPPPRALNLPEHRNGEKTTEPSRSFVAPPTTKSRTARRHPIPSPPEIRNHNGWASSPGLPASISH